MMLDAGVAPVGDPSQCHAVAVDARSPKFDGGIVTRLDCIPFGVVVNEHADRFYDEGEDLWPRRYAIWGRLIAAQPHQTAYAILDSKAAPLFLPSVFPPIVGESIPALADRLGLPPARLDGTITAFNRAVRAGRFDPGSLDECRTVGLQPDKTHWARPIDTPPFWGYPMKAGITFTYLGVEVDRQARVRMTGGNAMANVFAAGEIMAGNVLTRGYAAGVGMTIGTVFGRIAGQGAADHARG
jgi:tricarballylate dehydrogenase